MNANPPNIPHSFNSNNSLANDSTAPYANFQKNISFSNSNNQIMPLNSNNSSIAPMNYYYYPQDFPQNLGAFPEQVYLPQPPLPLPPFYEFQGSCPNNLNPEGLPYRNVFPQNFPYQPRFHTDIATLQNQYMQTEFYIQELQNIQNHLKFCKQQIAQGISAPYSMNPPREMLPSQARMFPGFEPSSYFNQNQMPQFAIPQIIQQTQNNSPLPKVELTETSQNITPNYQDNSINQKRSYGALHKDSSQTKIEESSEDLEQSAAALNKKVCNEETKTVSSPPQQVRQVPQLIINQINQQSSRYVKLPAFEGNNLANLCSMAQEQETVKNQNSSIDQLKKLVKQEFNNQNPQIQVDLLEKKKAKKDREAREEDSEERKAKKEIQNDSNYTKNLLKGFRRFTVLLLRENKEALERFSSYFYDNSLSNEFILCLLDDSPFMKEFQQFLDTDPSWWIKEAKIKDVSRQVKFFEAVKTRNYTEIRTKRKTKKGNLTISPSALSMLLISQPHIRCPLKSEPAEITTISNQAKV